MRSDRYHDICSAYESECSSDPVITNIDGDNSSCENTASGSTCEFSCTSGTPSDVATCTDGDWDVQTCDADCTSDPTYTDIDGDNSSCENTASGSTCEFQCTNDKAPSDVATCTNGNWDTQTCEETDDMGIDWAALRQDIIDFMPGGDEPFENNGPFMVRLAWHCAGTYRTADGRGGCDGGRITMDPELNWRDNGGLPDLIEELRPIKEKYEISWGDFIVFQGTTAIEEMGGPEMRFCGGREDVTAEEADEESNKLNEGRPEYHHDLIYVDPEVDGNSEVRETFTKMGFNDQEIVAVVGGGHAFGGCHASRSGFDGFWTSTPSVFTNDFYNQLLQESYTYVEVSENNHQFEDSQGRLMLKTDKELIDDESFLEWIEIYANDYDRSEKDFGLAWEKLMNRDMGDRPCTGPDYPAVSSSSDYEDYSDVTDAVDALIESYSTYAPSFMRLAFNCAATARSTDHHGGCDGARIRHSPESEWTVNNGLNDILHRLESVKDSYDISWSDLIVLTGYRAILSLGGPSMDLCPGRVDDEDGSGSDLLSEPFDEETASVDDMVDFFKVLGLTEEETVAIIGGMHSTGISRGGFDGVWADNSFTVEYFDNLMTDGDWTATTSVSSRSGFADANEKFV
eukprot:UN22647